ncbi:efflux RND transporter periplasmic adaptor subunit [Pseudoalteromonas ulvae]|uniref:Efflux transporter periplasmic adaptor subunit n=1 Tax=Pseudoalteromonas ulvae TaxID=107327 RepID=A0A244CSV6_PSEDV|nr:efflux RND transporter periplasmic adaptor subunit [Pseudoalteromonas ulvae]OUL58319.1 efflux transporter periplasmic adaptor subunit [Pseudoalteromonas ulvae]
MATKKQILIPLSIGIIAIAVAGSLIAMKKPPEEKEETIILPLVKTSPAKVEAVSLDVRSHGLVMAKDQTKLVAQVSGQVVSVSPLFEPGRFVQQGEVLVRIDPNDYEAALTEADASLAQARSALEIERAQAHVAQSEWDRISKNSNEAIPSELYLRKPQLAEKLARYRAAEATVKRASRNLERTYIKAPYDAIIADRDISLGSVVNQGSVFGVLNATQVAEIRLPVPDKDLQYLVNNGLGANVNLSATYAGQDVVWPAKIVRSEGVIDNKSRMTYLVAQVNDPYALTTNEQKPLRFGAYVNATIEGQQIAQATRIPHHLVKNNRVAILNDDNTLSFRTVDIVREQNNMVITKAGLQAGEHIITSALEYPTEGMKLDPELTKPLEPASTTQLAMKED